MSILLAGSFLNKKKCFQTVSYYFKNLNKTQETKDLNNLPYDKQVKVEPSYCYYYHAYKYISMTFMKFPLPELFSLQ